jgi:beta-N-acetylhexosaminidase
MTRLLLGLSIALLACSQEVKEDESTVATYALSDFYSLNPELDAKVNALFNEMDQKSRISQMIVVAAGRTGKPTKTVERLITKKMVGGVLMLSGEKQQLSSLSARFDSLSLASGNLPLLFSSDAEPSLINLKIKGTQSVPKTMALITAARCDSVSQIISHELLSMRIKHNYAPVVDMSADNAAITNRTFGNDSAAVVGLSSVFISTSQKLGVAATAKHFPGHGLVSGDTHNRLVTIDGELREVNNYMPLIEQGVVSIMVGHIAVENNKDYNTQGLPSSCSRAIVTDLLKTKMGFKGIVITDAMNMGALKNIEKASFKAVMAGCDMILMEPDESGLLEDIDVEYGRNTTFKEQVDHSVKKILRLKYCLNLVSEQ